MNLILHRRISSLSLLMAAFLLAGTIPPASAQQSAPPAPSFSTDQLATIAQEACEAAEQALQATGGSAVSIALGDGTGTVWAGQYGFSDKGAGKAPSADTMFGIGSTSKMFATAAAMILVDKGLVQLDMPLVRYLPEFRMATPGYEKITVRMLLNHSAGFPGTDYRNGISRAPIKGYPEQIEATLAESRLKREPGWMNVYANDGFTMVELLVKAMTGLDFTEFVARELLAPLGMNHSRYPLASFPEGSFAKAYKGDRFSGQEYLGPLASGGLYSTPSDLTRFAAMLIGKGALKGKRILSSKSVAAMAVDQTANTFNPLPTDYMRFGLGWDTVVEPGMNALGLRGWQKGGDVTGLYGATMIVLPDEHMAAIVAGASGISSGGSSEVAESVLLRALVEKGRLAAMPSPLAGSAAAQRQPGIAERIAIEGYCAASGYTARADSWYSSDDPAAMSLRFIDTEKGRYFGIRIKSGFGHYTVPLLYAQKLENAPPLSEAWKARTNETWLLANETPSLAEPGDATDPRVKVASLSELPGYVSYAWDGGINIVRPVSGDESLATMFLLIPGAQGRDLNDLVSEKIGETEYLHVGGARFRAASTVPGLGGLSGNRPFSLSKSIIIGKDGFGEWSRIAAPSE